MSSEDLVGLAAASVSGLVAGVVLASALMLPFPSLGVLALKAVVVGAVASAVVLVCLAASATVWRADAD